MKNKIHWIISLVLVSSFSSCTSYYYSTLSSNNEQVKKSENGNFIIENDTVRIMYNFYGENAPITISVFNKTDQPLYVDWHKSAIIIDDLATSYKDDEMMMDGRSSGYSYKWDNRVSSSEGAFSGSITLPRDAEFIPPQSKVMHTPLALDNLPFKEIPNNQYKKVNFCKTNGDLVKVKKIDFSETDSPLNFRSYLTIYSEGDPAKPLIFNHEFYISNLIKTGSVSPSDFVSKQGDTFYLKEVRGNTAAAIATVVVISAANVALDTYINNKYYK